MLYRAILLSETTLPAYGPGDLAIWRQSERRNSDTGVTGFLHREGSHFCQAIEGPAKRIVGLLNDQGWDKRHFNLRLIEAGPVRERSFASWMMGYAAPNDARLSRILNGRWDGLGADASAVLEFLQSRSLALSAKLSCVQHSERSGVVGGLALKTAS